MAPREGDPGGRGEGRDRARAANGDAGLRTEEVEPEQSGIRGVGDPRGLPGGGRGGPRGTESRGTQEIVRKERRRGEWVRTWVRKTGKRKEM